MLADLTSANYNTFYSLLAEGWSYAKPIGGGVVLCKNAFLMIKAFVYRTVSATVNRLPRIPIHVWSRNVLKDGLQSVQRAKHASSALLLGERGIPRGTVIADSGFMINDSTQLGFRHRPILRIISES